MLTQGKDDNEAGRKKDKQETANFIDREYNIICHVSDHKMDSMAQLDWITLHGSQ